MVARHAAFLALLFAGSLLVHGLDWHLRNPRPTPETIRRILYTNGLFFAVGGTETNILLLSQDGTNWTVGPGVPCAGLNDLIFANGLYVAAAQDGIVTSPDGTNWTRRYTSNPLPVRGVAYGHGRFLAVGQSFAYLDSADGITWNMQPGGPFAPFSGTAIIFAAGRFVAIANDVHVSTDGINWGRNSSFQGIPGAIAHLNGQFHLGTSFDFYRSSDGTNWTRASGTAFLSGKPVSMAYGNGHYFAVTESSLGYSSINGSNWVERALGSNHLRTVHFAQGRFLAGGSAGHLRSSSDTTNWTAFGSYVTSFPLFKVEYLNGQFIAVGESQTVVTSTNGTHWQRRAGQPGIGGPEWRALAYGHGVYVTGGENYSWSTNLEQWTYGGFMDGMQDVAFGHGVFVAVTAGFNGGKIYTSRHGTNWVLQTNLFQNFHDVLWADGRFLAVGGSSGEVAVSTNGTNWIRGTANSPTLKSVTWHDGRYTAVGLWNDWFISTNGLNWQQRAGLADHLGYLAVTSGNGLVVAADELHERLVTLHGAGLASHRVRSSTSLHSVAYGNGRFVAVGWDGQIWQSDPVVRLRWQSDGLSVSGPDTGAVNLLWSATLPATNWQAVGTVMLSNTPSPFAFSGPGFYRAVYLE